MHRHRNRQISNLKMSSPKTLIPKTSNLKTSNPKTLIPKMANLKTPIPKSSNLQWPTNGSPLPCW